MTVRDAALHADQINVHVIMKMSTATSAGFVWSLGHKTTPYIGLAAARGLSTRPALPDGSYKVLEESTIVYSRLRLSVERSPGCQTRNGRLSCLNQALISREENICRFCRKKLPDWKQRMTPEDVTPSRTAVMAVVLNGEEHRITVEPGRKRKHFEREIRRLFKLSQEDELEFTFDCQTPGNGCGGCLSTIRLKW